MKTKHHTLRARRSNESQNRKRWLAKGYRWRKTGGGTMLVRIPGCIRFPSDDTYENLVTGEVVEFTCTTEAHFKMPRVVKRLSEVSRLPGVNPRFRRCFRRF
jgi:hypothetical protein